MNKIIFFQIALLAFTLPLSAQSDVSKSNWQSKEMVVDGANSEWQKPFNLYDSKSGLMFEIANDSTNLFLCFIANDELKIRKMMRAGWKLELSSKEKNKKFTASVTFPPRQMMGGENKSDHNNMARKKGDFNGLTNAYKLQFQNIKTLGFRTKNGVLPLIDSNGIKVSMGADSAQGVVYEIAIPVKELFDETLLRLNELITLNVTVNAMEAPGGNEYHGREHGGQGGEGMERSEGGEGRMHGSQMGGMNGMGGRGRQEGAFETENESRSYGSGERSAMFEEASFKQKFTLTGH